MTLIYTNVDTKLDHSGIRVLREGPFKVMLDSSLGYKERAI